jgi:hypothetical protein
MPESERQICGRGGLCDAQAFLLKVIFRSWIRQGFHQFLRMPLKRTTPSFIVEYRQIKRRLNPGGAKLDSVEASLAPTALNETTHRVAISAFRTASAKQQAGVTAHSIPAGRIPPSLVEADPVTDRASRGRPNNLAEPRKTESRRDGSAESDSCGGAWRQVEHITPAPTSQTAARPLGDPIHRAEGLEPPLAVAGALVGGQPVAPRLGVGELATPKSRKRTSHPVERQENLDEAGSTGRSDIALTNSVSDASAFAEPSSSVRKGRILGRYVFRDELRPGENWKRRIETRRERRG